MHQHRADLLDRIADEVLASEGVSISDWQYVGAILSWHVPDEDILALAANRLEAGEARKAGVILGLRLPVKSVDGAVLLARTMHELDDDGSGAAEELANRILVEFMSEPYSPGPEAARPLIERAHLLRDVADEGSEGATWLRKIAGWLEDEGKRRVDLDGHR